MVREGMGETDTLPLGATSSQVILQDEDVAFHGSGGGGMWLVATATLLQVRLSVIGAACPSGRVTAGLRLSVQLLTQSLQVTEVMSAIDGVLHGIADITGIEEAGSPSGADGQAESFDAVAVGHAGEAKQIGILIVCGELGSGSSSMRSWTSLTASCCSC